MIFLLLSILFGLAVGSFLNVAINRIKLGQSINGRSQCPHCKKPLQARHLVPVISYLVLGGRCAYCKKPISVQYALVEAGTAIVFALIQAQYGFTIEMVFLWVIAACLIVIGVYDYKHQIIPDIVVFPAIGIAFLYVLFQDFSAGCAFSWSCATLSGLLGALVISGFFFFQYAASKGRWIGFGDVKFGILLGLTVGFINSIVLLFMAYTVGAVVGVLLISLSNKKLTSKLAFGIFLSAAGIATIIWGDSIAAWYGNLIGF